MGETMNNQEPPRDALSALPLHSILRGEDGQIIGVMYGNPNPGYLIDRLTKAEIRAEKSEDILSERDREIERLPLTHVWKAQDGTVKAKLYGTPDLDLVAIQNQLTAKDAEAADLRASLQAAIQRADEINGMHQDLAAAYKADSEWFNTCIGHWKDEEKSWKERDESNRSALAAARKALDKWREIAINMHAHRDYVRSLDSAGLTEALRATERFDPHLAALYRAMLEDRAALNGDSHADPAGEGYPMCGVHTFVKTNVCGCASHLPEPPKED